MDMIRCIHYANSWDGIQALPHLLLHRLRPCLLPLPRLSRRKQVRVVNEITGLEQDRAGKDFVPRVMA
jgi:hypothetical protein